MYVELFFRRDVQDSLVLRPNLPATEHEVTSEHSCETAAEKVEIQKSSEISENSPVSCEHSEPIEPGGRRRRIRRVWHPPSETRRSRLLRRIGIAESLSQKTAGILQSIVRRFPETIVMLEGILTHRR